MEAFRLLGDVLRREGFPLNSIIRQWNYIERITAFDGPDQHYQAFNNADLIFIVKRNGRMVILPLRVSGRIWEVS